MNERVLLIAFHFPPFAGSSGVQRTLKFSQYLPQFGWDCAVLTTTANAYESTDSGQLGEIGEDVPVWRAFALDTARHLRVMRRYPGFLALPDRWISWLLCALPVGLLMIIRLRPKVLWCTYPIATAHVIGWLLSKLTGIPLIADFRDSMTEEGFPIEVRKRRAFVWIEEKVIRHAACSVFTTPSARRMYIERYPDVPEERFVVIENAFDEENFQAAEASRRIDEGTEGEDNAGVFRLLHSGVIYPQERDPTSLFKALALAKASGKLDAKRFRLILRASGHEEQHSRSVSALGIEDLVEFAPPVPYRQALLEITEASGLLLLQAANCNHQIPAKVYEYFRAGRPIFALTDANGDTASVLRSNGVDSICAIDDEQSIHDALLRFVDDVNSGRLRGSDPAIAARNTRQARSRQLAELLQLVGRA